MSLQWQQFTYFNLLDYSLFALQFPYEGTFSTHLKRRKITVVCRCSEAGS